jgi:superfamily I DNA and/or RNA helicase
VNADGISLPPG